MKKKETTNDIFSDFSNENTIPEYILKRKPSTRDMKCVSNILEDFGIRDIKIPKFETVLRLQKWMIGTIQKHLNKGEE